MQLRRVIVGLAISSAVALLAMGGIVQVRESRSWRAMQEVASTQAEQRAARDCQRQVIWGESRDELAFTHYQRAIDLAQVYDERFGDELVSFLPRSDADVAAEATELRARWRPILAELRAGAHCVDVRQPAAVLEQYRVVNLLAARAICNMAVLEARALRHAGHQRQAVEWTLDAATLGSDLVQNGVLISQMIGTALLSIATDGAWPDAALQQLDAPARELLAAGLARLDQQLDPRLSLQQELAFMANSLERAGSEFWGGNSPGAWRYGFSSRWMAAEAFLHVANSATALDGAGTDWPTRSAAMDRYYADATANGNAFVAMMTPNLRAAEYSVRRTIAQLRMLRIALELQQGRQLELPDPLGDRALRVTTAAEGVRIESQGRRNDKPIARLVAGS